MATHQELFLNSWHFLVFAAIAVLAFRVTKPTRLRGIVLLVFNLYFLQFFVADVYSAVLLAVLLAATYGVGQARVAFGDRFPTPLSGAIVLALWAFLFLVKDPKLFAPANPFFHFPVQVVGISYLVFRCINYVVDVEILDNRDPLIFINFMLFFPTLLAGPIERYDRFQQEYDGAGAQPVAVLSALHRIANGFLKKFVLADNLSVLGIFANPDYAHLAPPVVGLAVLLQLLIIYLDFSGYCDIMIAIASLMGLRIVENFDRPFSATDIQEFWTRWHMSLTSFIRDYIFTPLSRALLPAIDRRWHFAGLMTIYFLTMMVIALWHGTTLGFFVFGAVQGTALIALQVYRRYRGRSGQAYGFIGRQGKRAAVYVFMTATVTLWFYGPLRTVDILRHAMGL